MTEWYYACGGLQTGPVSFEQLTELARNGGLDPLKDLVWTSTMKDWVPAGQVSGIFNTPVQAPVSATDPSNPYSAPNSTWNEVARTTAGEALEEIIPGSEPIDVGGCVKRGFDLTIRHFGMILLLGIVYFGVYIGASIVLALMDQALGWGGQLSSYSSEFSSDWSSRASVAQNGSVLNMILSHVLSVFLSLGVTRIGLNIVSGKEFSIGMLFEGGKKLLPAIGASILFGLMVGIGLLLLIVPGIYLMVRYGFCLTAIVDRNMGVMESFEYSSSITTNNRMNLSLIWLLSILIMLAGCLALCIGIFFAMPVIWLAWTVAYRWMQYGHRAALDHHGTTTPMLSSL